MTLPPPALDALRDAFGERLLLGEPLARYTSARIGGPADAFLAAHTPADLSTAARIAWMYDCPLFVLGGGSNVLISDAGVRGLVIHNRASKVTIRGSQVVAEAGANTIQLARRLAKRGLSGFEWAIGVPGTLGGALYGNAGAHDGDMSRCTVRVDAATPEGEISYTSAEMGFEYRSSILKRERRRCVILRAVLQFTPGDPAQIAARMEAFNAHRRRTQPPGATVGSMFKNPPGDYAGRLIDAAGLKGTQVGGAVISTVHANFFLNLGGATAADVMALINLARERVRAQFGVELELEIELRS